MTNSDECAFFFFLNLSRLFALCRSLLVVLITQRTSTLTSARVYLDLFHLFLLPDASAFGGAGIAEKFNRG